MNDRWEIRRGAWVDVRSRRLAQFVIRHGWAIAMVSAYQRVRNRILRWPS